MPNGDVVSMPIPSNDRVRYSDLRYGKKSYREILKELKPSFSSLKCHLDPDLDLARRIERVKGWKPAFGQIGSSASYLMNTVGIGPGDLFLFFGNFRAVEECEGRYHFVTRTGDFYRDKAIQLIWGYLQVGEIITDGARIKREYPWHPHSARRRASDDSNILIVPRKRLSFAPTKPGCGLLPFTTDRVLTKKGANKATWTYNRVYAPNAIVGNRENAVRGGVYYPGIWQELGLEESAEASRWARRIVCM